MNLPLNFNILEMKKKVVQKKEYYSNGFLKSVCTYRYGKLDGKQKKYFKNGTLKSIEFFIEGIPENKHYFFKGAK